MHQSMCPIQETALTGYFYYRNNLNYVLKKPSSAVIFLGKGNIIMAQKKELYANGGMIYCQRKAWEDRVFYK